MTDRSKQSLRTLALQGAEDAAKLMVAAKGSYGSGLGDERLLLTTGVAGLRQYTDTLEAGGQPKAKRTFQRPDGQFVAEVVPQGLEGLFFGGYSGQVWITPGQEPTQGSLYRDQVAGKVAKGSVSLVLGAGNQVSVLMLDVLHTLLVTNAVVICKFNPVIDYLGSYVESSFQPLIERGFVKVVYGGAELGKFLCNHPDIQSVHLTGSAATYDSIVWGSKPKVGEPPLKKQVTAELGCVTPYIVAPGQWSQNAIDFQANQCVAGLVNSAGHNCCKLEILVTCKEWPQREAFVAAVRKSLSSIPQRVAWYPGSAKRFAAFKAKFPTAEELGEEFRPDDGRQLPEGYHPWLFASGLTPEQADLQTENWCGVLQEVALPCSSSSFLEEAVSFANERCWGSLSCSVIVPPETSAKALDKAVASLNYGSVNVNAPSFVGYCFPKLSWGAFPGNTPQEVESGIGTVHNTCLFDHVQKSVVYAPWIRFPTDLWDPRVRNLDISSYRALRFFASPSFYTVSTTAFGALRG